MDNFRGKLAVVTGGGSGMGRELVRQLAADGCNVALCDAFEDTATETVTICADESPDVLVTAHVADVSDETQMTTFRDEVADRHRTDHINLLFNNAGIGGAGSFVADEREEWDRTFAVCWGGVYIGCRVFLPMLLASSEGHIVNTSSVNGFWATLGGRPHTAYSAAKFAVKGFSEALLGDLRVNAPHIGVSVVMPGHIGTSIMLNSMRMMGLDPKELTEEQVDRMRKRITREGIDVSEVSDEDLRNGLLMQTEMFRDLAPTSAAQAATIILDGVRAGRWRILVGDDAEKLDRIVRESPEEAYEQSFFSRIRDEGIFGLMPQ